MIFRGVLLTCYAALVSGAVLDKRQSTNSSSTSSVIPINVDDTPVGVDNITAWALIYTYPLNSGAYYAFLAGETIPKVGVNALANQLYLASPADTNIIAPNADVLYSRVILDLSQSDLILNVPQYPSDRYSVWPVYDTYSNVIVELGSAYNSTPGQYLIRYAPDERLGLLNSTITGSSYPSNSSYEGVVNVPTAYASMLVRFEVLTNTTEDIQEIHALQNATTLTATPRTYFAQSLDTNPPPALTSLAPNGTFLGITTPQQQLSFAASLIPWAQPQIYSERYRVAALLGAAGLYNGTYTPPSDVNLTNAAIIANASLSAFAKNPNDTREANNGWSNPIEALQSNWTTQYSSRASTSFGGGQGQTVTQTLYPTWNGTNTLSIGPNNSLLLTFSGKPPVDPPGYWSFAIYGATRQLIPNSLFRFKQSSNSYQLVYENGQAIYGPNATNTTDGPFQVLVQSLDIAPPENWTSNWLPGDPSGSFYYLMRWYLPSAAFTDGSYQYPTVQVIPAIIGNTTTSSNNNTALASSASFGASSTASA